MLYETNCANSQIKMRKLRRVLIVMEVISDRCDRTPSIGILGFSDDRVPPVTEEFKKTLAKNIRHLLTMDGKKQVELARGLGVSDSSVSGWLSGRRTPTIEQSAEIAEFFGVSLSALFNPELLPDGSVPMSRERALNYLANDMGRETRPKRNRKTKKNGA